MSKSRQTIVEAALALVDSGYDGPLMGPAVERLFEAVAAHEREVCASPMQVAINEAVSWMLANGIDGHLEVMLSGTAVCLVLRGWGRVAKVIFSAHEPTGWVECDGLADGPFEPMQGQLLAWLNELKVTT